MTNSGPRAMGDRYRGGGIGAIDGGIERAAKQSKVASLGFLVGCWLSQGGDLTVFDT